MRKRVYIRIPGQQLEVGGVSLRQLKYELKPDTYRLVKACVCLNFQLLQQISCPISHFSQRLLTFLFCFALVQHTIMPTPLPFSFLFLCAF